MFLLVIWGCLNYTQSALSPYLREVVLINLILFLLVVYAVIGVGVAIYAASVAKLNLPALLLIALFWPAFLVTGIESGVIGSGGRKRLR